MVQTVWFMVNTCFLSGGLAFWYMLGRGYLHAQPPSKKPGHGVSNECLWQTTVHTHCHSLLLGELKPSCVAGEGPAEACTWLPLDFALHTFPLYWSCLIRFHWSKSQAWIRPYAESYGSCEWVSEHDGGLGDPQHNTKVSSFNIICGGGRRIAHLFWREKSERIISSLQGTS